MRFWRKGQTDLERELRAQRPQPRDEFVRMLSRQSGAPETGTPKPRRSAMPRVALVAAVTTVLAVSLGTAGALGSANSSVRSFGRSVLHLVQPPNAPDNSTSFSRGGGNSGGNTGGNSGNSGNSGGSTQGSQGGQQSGSQGDDLTDQEIQDNQNAMSSYDRDQGDRGDRDPFHHQYGHQIAICYHHHIIFVSPRDLLWYFFHGGQSFIFCLHRR